MGKESIYAIGGHVMLKFTYSQEEIDVFQYERYQHPIPTVMKQMHVLYLHATGKSVNEIAPIVGCHPQTVRNTLHLYQEQGIDSVKTLHSYRRESEAMEYRDTLVEEFTKRPPATALEAAKRIQEMTGVSITRRRAHEFLKRIGMKCRRAGHIPAKADPVVQKKFTKRT
jgi:transposase